MVEGDDITKEVVDLSGAERNEKNFDVKRIEKHCHKSAANLSYWKESKNKNGIANPCQKTMR